VPFPVGASSPLEEDGAKAVVVMTPDEGLQAVLDGGGVGLRRALVRVGGLRGAGALDGMGGQCTGGERNEDEGRRAPHGRGGHRSSLSEMHGLLLVWKTQWSLRIIRREECDATP
jgi:hypothetical protein